MANSETLHRLNRFITNPRVKFFAALLFDLASVRYTIVRLDPVSACNLRCRMCHFSDPNWRGANAKGWLTEAELERIAEQLFPQALQVHFGASMEPTTFRNYPWLIKLAKRYQVPFVGFTTNGQLLTRPSFEAMAAYGLDEITISTHGVRKNTYERLMKRASYDRHLQMLDDITAVRASSKKPLLRVNYTVNSENIDELQDFFDIYGSYNLSTLQIRLVFDLGDTEYKEKNSEIFLGKYQKALQNIILECKKRGVNVLANVNDPSHNQKNYSAYVYEKAFLRIITPSVVWNDNFDWRNESLDEYCRRTEWRKELASMIIRPREKWGVQLSQTAASDVF